MDARREQRLRDIKEREEAKLGPAQRSHGPAKFRETLTDTHKTAPIEIFGPSWQNAPSTSAKYGSATIASNNINAARRLAVTRAKKAAAEGTQGGGSEPVEFRSVFKPRPEQEYVCSLAKEHRDKLANSEWALLDTLEVQMFLDDRDARARREKQQQVCGVCGAGRRGAGTCAVTPLVMAASPNHVALARRFGACLQASHRAALDNQMHEVQGMRAAEEADRQLEKTVIDNEVRPHGSDIQASASHAVLRHVWTCLAPERRAPPTDLKRAQMARYKQDQARRDQEQRQHNVALRQERQNMVRHSLAALHACSPSPIASPHPRAVRPARPPLCACAQLQAARSAKAQAIADKKAQEAAELDAVFRQLEEEKARAAAKAAQAKAAMERTRAENDARIAARKAAEARQREEDELLMQQTIATLEKQERDREEKVRRAPSCGFHGRTKRTRWLRRARCFLVPRRAHVCVLLAARVGGRPQLKAFMASVAARADKAGQQAVAENRERMEREARLIKQFEEQKEQEYRAKEAALAAKKHKQKEELVKVHLRRPTWPPVDDVATRHASLPGQPTSD